MYPIVFKTFKKMLIANGLLFIKNSSYSKNSLTMTKKITEKDTNKGQDNKVKKKQKKVM